MKRFNSIINRLNEDMTCSSTFGAGQMHAPTLGQSSDFYAPGDARNIFGSVSTKKKKKKFKAPKINITPPKISINRRKFPGM